MNAVKNSESKTFAPLGHFKKVVPVGLTLKERQERMKARSYLKLELLPKTKKKTNRDHTRRKKIKKTKITKINKTLFLFVFLFYSFCFFLFFLFLHNKKYIYFFTFFKYKVKM
jgi:hypothetical protein